MTSRGWILGGILAACGGPADGGRTSGEGSGPPVLSTTGTESSGTGSTPISATSTPTGADDGTTADPTAGPTDDGPLFDLGVALDAPPPIPCLECSISLFTTASTSLSPGGDGLLVEVLLDGQLVYALDQWGPGRLVFSGDSNILFAEGECPVWSWLGTVGPA